MNLLINVVESMGANVTNSVLEHISEYICELSGGRVGFRILTNLCSERWAISIFRIPTDKLGWKGVNGKEVAKKIMEGYRFA